MSIVVLNEVLDSSRAKGTARLLLVVMAEQAHEDGLCWPGIERLAARVSTSERNIQLLTRELERLGELHVEYASGRSNTNRYRVPPPTTLARVMAEVQARLEKVKNGPEKVKVSALLSALEKVKISAEKAKASSPLASDKKVKDSAEKVKSSAERVKAASPEPTRTSLEPTDRQDSEDVDSISEGQSSLSATEEAQDLEQMGGADRAGAADATQLGTAESAQDQTTAQDGEDTQTTSNEDLPGGAAAKAMAALTGALAGLRQGVPDLIAEYGFRSLWLEIPTPRIRALASEKQLELGKKAYRGALIDALDDEARALYAQRQPAKTTKPTGNVNDLVRQRLKGGKS